MAAGFLPPETGYFPRYVLSLPGLKKGQKNQESEKMADTLENLKNELELNFERNANYRMFWNNTMSVVGAVIFAFGINFFVVPSNIYNGGVLGISQLLTAFVTHFVPQLLFPKFTSVVYYLLNVPLLILAFRSFGRMFFVRNVACVTIETVAMMIIPVPDRMLVDSVLTSTIIGGLITGLGAGLIFRSGAAAGGTDIIGMYLTKKKGNFSVGKLAIGVNAVIYAICAATMNLSVAIYSIIYSVAMNITIDRIHVQNIMTEMTIFTKKDPQKIIQFITEELNHSANYWEATSGYTGEKSYIVYTVVSQYDAHKLDGFLMAFDSKVFAVKNRGVSLDGNFVKKL